VRHINVRKTRKRKTRKQNPAKKMTSTHSTMAVLLVLGTAIIVLLHSATVDANMGRGGGAWGLFNNGRRQQHQQQQLSFSVATTRGGGDPDQSATDAALRADAKVVADDAQVEELYLPGLLDVRLVHIDQVRKHARKRREQNLKIGVMR
jgi:hypothetical protein